MDVLSQFTMERVSMREVVGAVPRGPTVWPALALFVLLLVLPGVAYAQSSSPSEILVSQGPATFELGSPEEGTGPLTETTATQLGLQRMVENESFQDGYVRIWRGSGDQVLFGTALRWRFPEDATREWRVWQRESVESGVARFSVPADRPSFTEVFETDDRRVFRAVMLGGHHVVWLQLSVPLDGPQEGPSEFVELISGQMNALPEAVQFVPDTKSDRWWEASEPNWDRIPLWSLAGGPLAVSVIVALSIAFIRWLFRKGKHPRPGQVAWSSLALGSMLGALSARGGQLSGEPATLIGVELAATPRHMVAYGALIVLFGAGWFRSIRPQGDQSNGESTRPPGNDGATSAEDLDRFG